VSSDNFYWINKHPDGGYAVEQGFASDEEDFTFTDRCTKFKSYKEAQKYAYLEYSEYGVVDLIEEPERASQANRT